jgi:hypothetical protein
MPTGRKRSVLLLSVAAIALALIGAGLIGAYAILSKRVDNEGAAPTGSMHAWVPEEAIIERLAILTLAGWTDQAVIDRCLLEGEADTALSVLANSVTLEDRTRAGLLLRIAPIYSGQHRPDLAGALYRKVGIIAVLSPDLSDLTRIELLLQAATGLTRDKQKAAAIAALDQAAVLVQSSADLKPAQRRQLAEAAQAGYAAAGDHTNTSALAYLDSEPAPASEMAVESSPAGAFVSLDVDAVESDSYRNIRLARQGAASELIQSLETRPGEHPGGLVAGLSDVLQGEDTVVMDLAASGGLPAMTRASLEVRWRARKRQIAGGLMGISLVPDWEAQPSQIDDALYAAWLSYYESAGEGVATSELERTMRQADRLRAELLAGELGLIPGYDVAAGAARLQNALEGPKTMNRGWILEIFIEEDTPHYSIVSP